MSSEHHLVATRRYEGVKGSLSAITVYECQCGFKFVYFWTFEKHIKETTKVGTEKTPPTDIIAERIEARIAKATWLEYDEMVNLSLYRAMMRGAELAIEECNKAGKL